MVHNIETSYGKFPTLIHFEKYWGDKISKAYRDGFQKGYKYFKHENLHNALSTKGETEVNKNG